MSSSSPDTPRSPEETLKQVDGARRKAMNRLDTLFGNRSDAFISETRKYVSEAFQWYDAALDQRAPPASERDPGLDDPDILADLLNNFETAPEHGKALARGYIERYVRALQKDRLSAPTLPEPPEEQ